MENPRDDGGRRSKSIGGVNGAWLGPVDENSRRRKTPSMVRALSARLPRAIRIAVPRAGAGNFWIGVLIGTAVAGLVFAMT